MIFCCSVHQSSPDTLYTTINAVQADVLVSNKVNISEGNKHLLSLFHKTSAFCEKYKFISGFPLLFEHYLERNATPANQRRMYHFLLFNISVSSFVGH